ncbi:hypothetical protein DASC09_016800 [Saccharomycopsis crataegensis]|uniref:Uncharacterized protein n=1 Tax=Saccharomycopsis crataegensis TaxID=43959 RepID=A0AAV5QJ11_9ASCO|nr:hypothetical protein DASC09_016800 [Saccharomycopsis crataegensis]
MPTVANIDAIPSGELEAVRSKAISEYNEKKGTFEKSESVDNDSIDTGLSKPEFKSNKDIVVKIIDSSDDPELKVWNVRSFILGVGLAIFGGVLQCIFYFKPQTIVVNGIFLMLLAYVGGEAMSMLIPRKGWLKYLNPYPFNKKEHTLITIMASSAANCALAIEVLAVQKLWYTNQTVNKAVSIFFCLCSQLLGYGLCGLMRNSLVYPTDMFYPNIVAQVSTIHTLHNDKQKSRMQLKWFYLCFAAMFFYEIVPEWMFPLLIGFSPVCISKAGKNPTVSRIFGGTNGNEGLGFFSFCFDWNYIASTANPMAQPLVAVMNNIFGYILCIVVFLGVYYGNVWKAKNFPFLSQDLFYEDSAPGNYLVYNQSLILDSKNKLDPQALQEQGVPYMTATYVVYLIATNLSVAATFTYMYLFHWDKLQPTFNWVFSIKEMAINWKSYIKFWEKSEYDQRLTIDGKVPEICDDPHFKAYMAYEDVPHWWYGITLLLSFVVAIICLYKGDTGLPWWMLIIAMLLAFFLTLMLGGLVGIFGFGGTQMQTICQLIGAYIKPGYPLANMYFTLFGYNSVSQAFLMLQDLKQAEYMKLAPKSAFFAQLIGTAVGAIFNFIMMESIVNSKAEILLSIQGTAIWSGQNVQQYNTQGIAWGALAKEMFSSGKTYQMVPYSLIIGLFIPIPFYILHRLRPTWHIDNINIPIMIWYIGWLCVGVNASIWSYFIVALVSQFYWRKYKPKFFQEYNYIIAAGLTGGVQVAVFILSFAVAGASGSSYNFPQWWGNYSADKNGNTANYDWCAFTNDG